MKLIQRLTSAFGRAVRSDIGRQIAPASHDEAERGRLEANLVNNRGVDGQGAVAFYPVNDRTRPLVDSLVGSGAIRTSDWLVVDAPQPIKGGPSRLGPRTIGASQMADVHVLAVYLLESDERIERWLAGLDYSRFHFSVNDLHLVKYATGGETLWKPYRCLKLAKRETVVPPLHYSNYAYIQYLKTIIRPGMKVLDSFAGAGPVGLALAKECPSIDVCLFEMNPVSIGAMRDSIAANFGSTDKVRIFESNLFTNIPAEYRFDLIVGNPPHNLDSNRQYVHLPRMLYVQGNDLEMEIHRDFFTQARSRLLPGGKICLLENGQDTCIQADHLRQLLREFPDYVVECDQFLPGSQFYQITVRLK